MVVVELKLVRLNLRDIYFGVPSSSINTSRFVTGLFFFAVTAIFFLVPFFWHDQGFYFAGGDDTQLFYLFPGQMLRNWVFNINTDNMLGSVSNIFAQSFSIPFLSWLWLLKKALLGVNLQSLLWGLNLSLGFFFFVRLLDALLQNKKKGLHQWPNVVGALIYVLSPFVYLTLWKHLLVIPLFLIAIVPATLYFLTIAARDKSFLRLCLAAVLILSVPILPLGFPWILGTMLSLIPIIFILITSQEIRLSHLLWLGLMIAIMSGHWLYPNLQGLFLRESIFTSSAMDSSQNIATIRNVVGSNNLAYPLLLSAMPRWFESQSLEYLINLVPLNLILLLPVFFGWLFLTQRGESREKLFLIAGLCSFLVAIYLYTVNITDIGLQIYLWANEAVPGFTSLRNNFDKVGVGLAFSTGFVVALGLHGFINQHFAPTWAKHLAIGSSLLVVIYQGFPLLTGYQVHKPIWTTQTTYPRVGAFHSDFIALTNYLAQLPNNARLLWLPLNVASYIQIPDAHDKRSVFSGPSPLLFLSGKQDLSGQYSFGRSIANESLVFGPGIVNGDFEELLNAIQRVGVGYVIVNNSISPDLRQSYLYSGWSKGDIYRVQMDKLANIILGSHIIDFGEHYSLYKIKDNLMNDIIEVSEGAEHTLDKVWTWSGIEYRISFSVAPENVRIILREPYSKLWELRVNPSDAKEYRVTKLLYENFGNAWEVHRNLQRTGIQIERLDRPIQMVLGMKYGTYQVFSWGISIAAWFAILIYLISAMTIVAVRLLGNFWRLVKDGRFFGQTEAKSI